MIKVIFLCNFKHFGYEALTHLSNNGIDVKLVSTSPEHKDKTAQCVSPDTILLTHDDMNKAVFPIDLKNMGGAPLPVDQEILEKMSECQSLFIPMMHRLNYYNISSIKIVGLYYEYLSFWHGVFKAVNPDVIVFHNTPHEGSNYVACHLAQQLGIKTLIPERVLMGDRFFFLDHMYSFPIYTPKDYPALKKISGTVEVDWLHRMQKAATQSFKKKSYIDNFFSRLKNKIFRIVDLKGYDYDPIFSLSKSYPAKSLSKSYPSKLKSRIIAARSKYLVHKLKKWYKSKSITPNLKCKYIYFPLHLQPEMTTLPKGRFFWNHQSVLDFLLATMPNNCKIYIKDHPRQFSRSETYALLVRDTEFYEKLIENDNVHLIDLEFDSKKLIESSMCVATITGTSGWEAMLSGIPVCVFGYPWYSNCPEAFRVNSVGELKSYLLEVFHGKVVLNQKRLNAYFHWMREEVSYKAALNPSDVINENKKSNSITIAKSMIDAILKVR